jgi:hypothetical protein
VGAVWAWGAPEQAASAIDKERAKAGSINLFIGVTVTPDFALSSSKSAKMFCLNKKVALRAIPGATLCVL